MSNYITVTDLYKNRDKYENIWINIASHYTIFHNLKQTKKSYGNLKKNKKKLGNKFSYYIEMYESFRMEYLLDCVIKGIGYAMTSSNKNLESDILDVNYILNSHETSISFKDLIKIIKNVNPEYNLSYLNSYMLEITIELANYIDLYEYYPFEGKAALLCPHSLIDNRKTSYIEEGVIVGGKYTFYTIPFIYILNLRADLPDEKKEIFDQSLKNEKKHLWEKTQEMDSVL